MIRFKISRSLLVDRSELSSGADWSAISDIELTNNAAAGLREFY